MIEENSEYLILRDTPIFKSGYLGDRVVPISVLKKTIDAWDMCPIVIGHPQVNGELLIAKCERILDKHIGFLLNSRVLGNFLNSDLFIRKKKISFLLLDNLRNGEKYGVSVGINGEHNGDHRYYFIIPDHLAIMNAGEYPACKYKDGCGINIKNRKI